jgi:hypothetical protein
VKTLFTKIVLSAFMLALFQGCATKPLSARTDFDPATSENGLIIGSITFPTVEPRFTAYHPYLQGADNKNSVEFIVEPETTRMIKHNGDINNGKTYLFAIERAPGSYDLNKIRVISKGYMNSTWGDEAKGFSIPVDVKKGEIVYIGEVLFNEYASDPKTVIKIADNFERDLKGLKIKQPVIDWSKAKKGPVKLNTK